MKEHARTNPPNRLLRMAREQRGWSQEQVAEQIGTTAFTVCRWERGSAFPTPYFRQKLSALFALDPESLGLIPPSRMDEIESATPESADEAQVPDTLPLPSLMARLIGRDTQFHELQMRLCRHPGQAVVALYGAPGVGKTQLAVELARSSEARLAFPDGVLWVGLGPDPQMTALLMEWGNTLGMAQADLTKQPDVVGLSTLLRRAIGNRRMLLVIDDVWHIDHALTCKIGGPSCSYLLTTRFPPLAAQFAHTNSLHIAELSEQEGWELVSRLAPEAVAQEAEAARDLVRQVGGLPLALMIIGQYLYAQAITGQPRRVRAALRRLQQAESRLALGEPSAPLETPPHLSIGTPRSVRAAIAVSVAALPLAAQQVLHALAVFSPKPEGFSEAAAQDVADLSVDETIENLDRLLDAGLVESSGPDRYTMHPTITDFARLGADMTLFERRLAGYFAHFAVDHADDTSALDRESHTLLAGLAAALHYPLDERLAHAINDFAQYLIWRGLFDVASTALLAARAAMQETNLAEAARAGVWLGWIADKRGAATQGLADGKEALNWARQSHDERAICAALHLVGVLYYRRGDSKRAEALLREGLNLAHDTPYREHAKLLLGLGSLYIRSGKLDDAETCFREGMAICEQQGAREGVCAFIQSLGSVADRRGDRARSRQYNEEGLALARSLGMRESTCIYLHNLAVHDLDQDHLEQAEEYLREGLELVQEYGFQERRCTLLIQSGRAAELRGDADRAQVIWQEALDLARSLALRERACYALLSLGELTIKHGMLEQAEIYLNEALVTAQDIEHQRFIAKASILRGECHLRTNKIVISRDFFEQGLATAQKGGSQDIEGWARFGLARVASATGDRDEALSQGNQSLDLLEETDLHLAGEVRRWLAEMAR